MSLGLFTPLFLAGAALLTLPWLIHRIRRPERIPTPFSSLMFVPETKKQVVQRRRIKHWLLMLLRMLGLLLLCFAFSRPYFTALAVQLGDDRPVRHLILVDTSYSMGTLDWFSKAQERANEIVDASGDLDAVGIAVFDREFELLAPVFSPDDPQSGSKSRAQEAIARAELGFESTSYTDALRAAESVLLADVDPETATDTRRVLHVITDLQAAGVDEGYDGWRVSPLIECYLYPVGERPKRSAAIIDSSIAEGRDGDLNVRVKVRNWSLTQEEPAEVKIASGEFEESQIITVGPSNTGQAVFDLPRVAGPQAVTVRIGPDALDTDNVNYLAWNPEQRPVLGVVDAEGATFSSIALASEDSPWEIAPVVDAESLGAFQAMVYTGGDAMDEDAEAYLGAWVKDGGGLLLQLNANPDDWPRALLNEAGINLGTLVYEETKETQYRSIDWVDLDHEMFAAFRSPRLSDFTPIRFFNFATAELSDDVRVLARFESETIEDGPPAAVAVEHGEGTLVVWLFHVGLESSTLPKSPRFVPMLFETLRYLTPSSRIESGYMVGSSVFAPTPPRDAEDVTWEIAKGDGEAEAWTSEDMPRWDAPGIAKWRVAKADGENETWHKVSAVNVDPTESDPGRITESEFALKYFSSNTLEEQSDASTAQAVIGSESVVRNEFGYLLIVVLVLWLLAESAYAARLA